jgi:hypothetical protein
VVQHTPSRWDEGDLHWRRIEEVSNQGPQDQGVKKGRRLAHSLALTLPQTCVVTLAHQGFEMTGGDDGEGHPI